MVGVGLDGLLSSSSFSLRAFLFAALVSPAHPACCCRPAGPGGARIWGKGGDNIHGVCIRLHVRPPAPPPRPFSMPRSARGLGGVPKFSRPETLPPPRPSPLRAKVTLRGGHAGPRLSLAECWDGIDKTARRLILTVARPPLYSPPPPPHPLTPIPLCLLPRR